MRDEGALGDRIQFVEGSFFDRVPEADVYVLSTILHDWSDEKAAAILRTVRAAAKPGSRLILLEAVVPEGNEPGGGKWLDLLMLALFAGPRAQRGPVASAARDRAASSRRASRTG